MYLYQNIARLLILSKIVIMLYKCQVTANLFRLICLITNTYKTCQFCEGLLSWIFTA